MGIIGISIPAFGNLQIHMGDYTFRVWAIGLIGMAVMTAIWSLKGRS
jgi:hypothetical protein